MILDLAMRNIGTDRSVASTRSDPPTAALAIAVRPRVPAATSSTHSPTITRPPIAARSIVSETLRQTFPAGALWIERGHSIT